MGKNKKIKNTKNTTTIETIDGGSVTISSNSNGKLSITITRGNKELPEDRKYRIQHTLRSGYETTTHKEKRNKTRSNKNRNAIKDSLNG